MEDYLKRAYAYQSKEVLALSCVKAFAAGVCSVNYLYVKDCCKGGEGVVCGDGRRLGWWWWRESEVMALQWKVRLWIL